MGQHLGLDRSHDIRAAEIDLSWRRSAVSVPATIPIPIPILRVVQHIPGSLARFGRAQRYKWGADRKREGGGMIGWPALGQALRIISKNIDKLNY
jgi:hypothetical protein